MNLLTRATLTQGTGTFCLFVQIFVHFVASVWYIFAPFSCPSIHSDSLFLGLNPPPLTPHILDHISILLCLFLFFPLRFVISPFYFPFSYCYCMLHLFLPIFIHAFFLYLNLFFIFPSRWRRLLYSPIYTPPPILYSLTRSGLPLAGSSVCRERPKRKAAVPPASPVRRRRQPPWRPEMWPPCRPLSPPGCPQVKPLLQYVDRLCLSSCSVWVRSTTPVFESVIVVVWIPRIGQIFSRKFWFRWLDGFDLHFGDRAVFVCGNIAKVYLLPGNIAKVSPSIHSNSYLWNTFTLLRSARFRYCNTYGTNTVFRFRYFWAFRIRQNVVRIGIRPVL